MSLRLQATTRLVASPAVVTDHESAAMRRMMKLVNQVTHKLLGRGW